MFELTLLKGVGKASVQKFNKLGISTVLDLLFHLPLRYQDKTKIIDMGNLHPNQFAQIQGRVVKAYIINSRTPILVCEISDGEDVIPLKFFNFYYSQRVKMHPDSIIRAYGEVRFGQYGLEMLHPEYQHLQNEDEAMTECLTAIYPKTEGLSQKLIQKTVKQAIELMLKGEFDLEELLPANYLDQQQLPTLLKALQYVHLPPPDADVDLLIQGEHNTQHRLVLEEILAHLLTLHKVRTQVQSHMATPLILQDKQNQKFLNKLPFDLTTAQTRVVNEIQQDLRKSNPMQRLLQGDVGSGKTVVSAMAMLAATANGYQAVMMAPTEILAEQHRSTLAEYFTKKNMAYLSGAIKGTARVAVLEHIASTAKIIIGTHALFQADVVFNKLALIVIDEQHRFGVHQRLALKNKGQTDSSGRYIYPHTLIMTATPIPRTLAQTAYANLDLSIIDELPPNRKVINTVLLSNDKVPQLAERIKQACERGEQAYWVCTLIDESEVLRAKAATDTASELQQMFPDLNIALIHGRLKS
ncbi:MAG: ATP-dependent DNA helicase RecG, partial [Proteobacteria bacterium]|nr:ATP-dependent DNA helicase RecG [Pseudomonadota bacterium]